MSGVSRGEPVGAAQGDPGAFVAEYLRRHREFFVEHPELLAELRIPHPSGGAVSLIERQLEVLRAENRQLKARLFELVSIARDNEELARRLHRLTLRLLEADSPARVFAVIEETLRGDFSAEAVVVRIFASPVREGDWGPEFVGREAPLRELCAEFLEGRRPFCGRLKRAQQEALFGTEPTGSAVVLPLAGRHWEGLLAVASRDPQRYGAEMGMDLLAHLGDIASLIIQPWVAAAP